MGGEYAREVVSDLRWSDGSWRNPLHVATGCWRPEISDKLSRDPQVGDIQLAEIHLNRYIPNIEDFCGIIAVDDLGIWFEDGDGGINDPIWRQRLIPWHAIDSLTLHQAS